MTQCDVFQAAKNDRDPDVVAHRLAEGEEAAEFIRTCIVQTRKTERGGFGELHAWSCERSYSMNVYPLLIAYCLDLQQATTRWLASYLLLPAC